MATKVKTGVDTVLQRVRDPEGTAHTRDQVREQLSQAEILVNTAQACVTVELPLLIQPHQQFYGPIFTTFFPAITRVVGVHDSGRDLPYVDWFDLHHFSGSWFRRIGGEVQIWSTAGREQLIIHPALDYHYEISVMGTLMPPSLTSDDQDFLIPDTHLPLVYDIAEVALLLKQRTFGDTLKAAMDRSAGRGMAYGKVTNIGARTDSQQQSSRPSAG